MLALVHAPNTILATPTRPVDLPSEQLTKIIAEMEAILLAQKDPEGVGLAANQVGLPYRLFLARFKTGTKEVKAFINPEVVDHSPDYQPEKKGSQLEGCLSLPNFYGFVKRWQWVKVKYQTIGTNHALQYCEEIFENFPAVIIQHEMDHLDGKIFVARILEQKGKLYRTVGKNKEDKEIWEEVKI